MNESTNTPRTPNHSLRRERQERGWSLQRVADEILARFPDAPSLVLTSDAGKEA